MKVNVRYWTEFGGSDTTMNVEEIPAFAEKFTIMSVTPHEETYTEQDIRFAVHLAINYDPSKTDIANISDYVIDKLKKK